MINVKFTKISCNLLMYVHILLDPPRAMTLRGTLPLVYLRFSKQEFVCGFVQRLLLHSNCIKKSTFKNELLIGQS